MLFELVIHEMPGLAESETSVSVKISGVKPNHSGPLFHVHITCGPVQGGGAVEIDV
jgi:hypothetical protein